MDLNHVRLTQSFYGNDDSKKKFSVVHGRRMLLFSDFICLSQSKVL
ncbi:hypothetical protein Hanom_Chr17g01554501 [Helianthus anomalus]